MTDNRLLRHLELESFKSIARLDLELGQLTVLVGENSAGKSSFMQAIVLASQIANSSSTSGLLSLIGDDVALGDFRNIRHSGLAADEITIAVTLRDDTAMSRPWLETSDTPAEEFRWTMTLSEPRPPAVGASLRRVAVSSSLIAEEIVVSQIDPQSEDPGEQDRAKELRRLLQRSIALTRAGGDGSLEIAVLAAADDTAALYSGTHSLRGRTPERIEFISVDGALPALTLRSAGNRRAAAEAFLWMSGVDHGIPTDLPLERSDTDEPQIPDELMTAFESWLSNLDDALAARSGKMVIPPPEVEPDWLASLDFDNAISTLADAPIPGAVERDHLHRTDLDVTTAAENIRAALARRVHLLGPLRDAPSPWYRPGERGTGIATLGSKGEYTVAYLDEHGSDRVVCPIPAGVHDLVAGDSQVPLGERDNSGQDRSLISAVHLWLRALGIAQRVELRPLGRILEFDLVDPQTNAKRDLTSVGVGASQVLPVIVLCLLAKPGDLVLLEQPELHLHPGAQQILGDFLLGISQTGRQLIVETHSEHLVNRLRLRMVEQRLDELDDAIRLLYAKRNRGATDFEELRPNKHGTFDEWPAGFFDQSPKESEAIVRAAVRRRREERSEAR